MTPVDLIWYVGYGSNLLRSRLITYLTGGAIELSDRAEVGSSDRSRPREITPVTMSLDLYFGRSGGDRWGPGGVAFVEPSASGATTFGLAYLLTTVQFLEVLRQENGWASTPSLEDVGVSPGASPTDVTPDGARPGWYRLVVPLEGIGSLPAVTFTNPTRSLAEDPAPVRYLQVMAQGLAAEHGLDVAAIADYFSSRAGVGRSRRELVDLLESWDLNRP